ncbi:RNA polymerase sigma factor [Streptomyces kanamyceticus]|uniref:RNA polymerase sigma factor n=1 Tax=Streptomyces kanamyceticus TaxID=1967 RepID=A0A5J6G9Y0_STRKN|nr:RNA polymerase sigma factor [Streptomyces kanamyceticus]QEU92279.1 RNA polymerase sigma factor [Streptomyces kanamyceticus]
MGQGGEHRRAAGNDEELTRALGAASAGDEAAFAMVYRCVHPGLLRYLRGLVREDAEDVASEAWLQIVRDLGRFHGGGGEFRRWAATVARHRAIDHLRRQRSRPRASLLSQDALELPGTDDTAAQVLESLSTARVLRLVATLPPDQGEAVLLRVVMGLDGPAAARVLGKRPAAVRAAAYRGLRRLAHELEEARSPRRRAVGGEYAMRRERRAAC